MYTHMYKHMYVYMCIYIYIYVYLQVARLPEQERGARPRLRQQPGVLDLNITYYNS